MFGGQSNSRNEVTNENTSANNLFTSLKTNLAPIIRFITLLIGIVAFIFMIYFGRKICRQIAIRRKAIQNGDYSYLIGQEYRKTKLYLQKINPSASFHYPKDMAVFLKNCSQPEIATNAEEMIAKAERNCYSKEIVNSHEANELIAFFKKIREKVKKDKK